MKTSILTTLSLCLLYLCISYSQPLSSKCNCGSSDDSCFDNCLNSNQDYSDYYSESNALPCGLIRTCPNYRQHPKCLDVPTTIPGRCTPSTTTLWPRTPTTPWPSRSSPSTGRTFHEVCSSKAEVTKYIYWLPTARKSRWFLQLRENEILSSRKIFWGP